MDLSLNSGLNYGDINVSNAVVDWRLRLDDRRHAFALPTDLRICREEVDYIVRTDGRRPSQRSESCRFLPNRPVAASYHRRYLINCFIRPSIYRTKRICRSLEFGTCVHWQWQAAATKITCNFQTLVNWQAYNSATCFICARLSGLMTPI